MAEREVYYRDLPLDPSVASNGDLSTVDNKESIRQSLQMIIKTARGSRIFAVDYGARIRGFLFEPFDQTTAMRIGEELRESIENYEKRIVLLDINVVMEDTTTSYDVEIIYQIINTSVVETFDK
jgi:hypothetical protein